MLALTITALALPALYDGSTDAARLDTGRETPRFWSVSDVRGDARASDRRSEPKPGVGDGFPRRREARTRLREGARRSGLPERAPARQLASTPPRVRIGQPEFYGTACADAYAAVRWYRARYDEHRRVMGLSPAPPVETGMACPRLRERAAYWVHAAKVNRAAADRVRARHANVARKLNRGLAGTPMAGTGRELEQAGREHGIHPAFIAAIAATESSYGAAMCGHFNAYGLGNCTGLWDVPRFRSWGESYRFMGKFLRGRWPHADTPWEFYGYAACDSCWGNRVAFWMRRLGFGHGVRYR